MSLRVVPPVRARVPLSRDSVAEGRARIEALFPGMQVTLLGSGTQALAAAVRHAAMSARAQQPEAIIPAYGCPDLVTACVQAGVRPRLVDIDAQCWGYDAAALDSAITSNTVAVVAVNLLGLGDDSNEIARIARGISLIHDSAQDVPQAGVQWPGDAIVMSFGRGKPINLLYGGALIHRTSAFSSAFGNGTPRRAKRMLDSRLAALAFNTLTHPSAYGLAMRLPGLRVGDTTYKAPVSEEMLEESFFARLGPALRQYMETEGAAAKWHAVASGWSKHGLDTVRVRDTPGAGRRMLRYPVLIRDAARRDALVERLLGQGIGASPMYAKGLTAINGLPEIAARQGPFPNANNFAARLLTLPAHSFVTDSDIERADRCIRTL